MENEAEVKLIKLELTEQHVEIVYRALLEMPAKYSLPVIQEVQKQVEPQLPKPEPEVAKKKES
jgi:hypothetical protein